MASIDTTPRSVDGHVAELLERVRRLEQRRALAYTADGRARFPSGIDSEGEGDVGAPGTGTPDPVSDLILTAGALFDEIYLDADWTLPADLAPVVGIELRLAKVIDPGGPGETLEIADVWRTGLVTSTRIRALEPNTTYELAVYTYSTTQISTPVTGRETTGVDTDPPGIPTGLAVSAGLRSLVATWEDVPDPDVIDGAGIYELEVWSDDGLGAPSAMLRRKRTAGTIVAVSDLDPETTYHVRIRAIDSSGNAGGWTGYVAVTTALVDTADLAVGAITADKAIIADAAIGTAQIADLAVTNAKIGSLSATKLTAGNIVATIGITTGRLQVGTGPGSTGVYIDSSGIRLYNGSTVVVHLNADTGAATFAGELSGATGTFAGALSAATGTFSGSLSAASGTFTGTLSGGAINIGSGAILINASDGIKIATGTTAVNRISWWQGSTLRAWIRAAGAQTTAFYSEGQPMELVCTGSGNRIYIGNIAGSPSTTMEITGGRLDLWSFMGSSQRIMDFTGSGFSYSLWADGTGGGSHNTRLWFDCPAGGEFHFGPRSGGDFAHRFRINAYAQIDGNGGSLVVSMRGSGHEMHSTSGNGVWIRSAASRVYIYAGQQRVASLHPSSGYVDHWAGTHVDASSRELKAEIRDAALEACQVVKAGRRIRRWRYANAALPIEATRQDGTLETLPPDPVHARERLGWVAEEAPDEIVVRDAEGNPEGISPTAAAAVAWAAIGEILDRLDGLEQRLPVDTGPRR